MENAIRWGVLGVANIARRAVIPAMRRSGNVRLAAIASRERARAEEAAREFGFARAHGSYEALLDDPDVQAVYIPLPNALHREWTIRCAESGKHVLCEKPLALSPAECGEMIAACREHRVLLMEAFMYRFHPRTEEVARLVRAGDLGEVRMVRAAFTFQATNPARNVRFRPDLGGGALYDVGCYTVNVSRMVLGEPEEVFACGRIGEYGVDEQVGALLRFGGGRLAVIDCGLTLPRREEYEVLGTQGYLRVPRAFLPGAADAEIEIWRAGERTSRSVPGAEQYQRMVEQFGHAIATGSPVGLTPEDASRNVGVIGALLASLRSGKPEPVAH
jgi:predicted dehydrogenase